MVGSELRYYFGTGKMENKVASGYNALLVVQIMKEVLFDG